MKRTQLIKYLGEYNCGLFREGANHTIVKNFSSNKMTAVPRHTEIGDRLANEICKQLEIPKIK